MNDMKKLSKVLLVFLLFFGMSTRAKAADEHYPFTVTFKGGSYTDGPEVVGTVTVQWDAGTQQYVLPYDAFHQFDAAAASNNSKYEFRGWHYAGIEGIATVNEGDALVIREDTTLVAKYALPGENVEYTVQYINAETGEKLQPDRTFYGTVGEIIVVAFTYFEGMQPQAYNLQKTLSSDPSRNIFPFQYRPIPQQEEEQQEAGGGGNEGAGGGNEGAGGGGQPAGGGGQPAGGGGEGTVNPDQGGQGGQGGTDVNPDNGQGGQGGTDVNPDDGQGGQGENIDDEPTPQGQPEDVIDLDDDDTPTTKPDGQGENEGDGNSAIDNFIKNPWTLFGTLGGGAGILWLLWYFLFKRKKDEDEDSKE